MRISGRLKVNSASALQFRDRQGRVYHEVNPPGPSSEIDVGLDDERGELDKGIRQRWLDRRVREREAAARRERNFARFLPADIDDAVSYLVELLRHDADEKTPIYLADPYFRTQLPSDARNHLDLRKIYLDIFATTAGTPLRILCAKKKPALDEPPPWWSTCAEQITAHVRVRSFRSQDGRTDGFHDRFLITPRREIMISHSFNGWHNHGVTFASLPYDVYRAEAERLWSMDVGSPLTSFPPVRDLSASPVPDMTGSNMPLNSERLCHRLVAGEHPLAVAVPGGSRTGLAWMATAGIAVALGESITVDLSWRYSDPARTPRRPGRVVWRDRSRESLPLDLAPTRARLVYSKSAFSNASGVSE